MSKSLLNDGWAHPGVFWWVQSSLNAGLSCNGIWTPVPRGRHRAPQKLCHQHQASQGVCSCRFLSCAHTWDTLQILMLLVEWFHVYSGLSCSESRLWVVYKPSASSGLFFGCVSPSIGEMMYSLLADFYKHILKWLLIQCFLCQTMPQKFPCSFSLSLFYHFQLQFSLNVKC